jgi:hypothetical protein
MHSIDESKDAHPAALSTQRFPTHVNSHLVPSWERSEPQVPHGHSQEPAPTSRHSESSVVEHCNPTATARASAQMQTRIFVRRIEIAYHRAETVKHGSSILNCGGLATCGEGFSAASLGRCDAVGIRPSADRGRTLHAASRHLAASGRSNQTHPTMTVKITPPRMNPTTETKGTRESPSTDDDFRRRCPCTPTSSAPRRRLSTR